MAKVRVRVPATSANLGPGFDCLGLALGLHNTFEVETLGPGTETAFAITGEGAAHLPRNRTNLFVRAFDCAWTAAGRAPERLAVQAWLDIPTSSGLGSSASAVVAGLAAAQMLLQDEIDRAACLAWAHQLEGHPDNAAAALYGGLTLVSAQADDVLVASVPVPLGLVVIALPAVRLSTAEARAALPRQVTLSDAVFNLGRALFVVRALQFGDYALLGRALADRWHEPYRFPLIPGAAAAAQAARAAGAVAVALSGAGPSLAAFAPTGQAEIAAALSAAFAAAGVGCRTFIVPIEPQGVAVL